GVQSVNVPGNNPVFGPVHIESGVNTTVTQTGTSIIISASAGGGDAGGHLHGLARWESDGGDTYILPDAAEHLEMVFSAGLAVDQATVTLSDDRTEIVFDAAPSAGDIVQAHYVIARL